MAFSLFSPCAPCCDVICRSGILCLEVRRCPQDIPTYGNLCDPYYGNPPMSGAYVEFYQQETDEYGITTSGVFVDGGYTGADGRFCAYAPTGLYWAAASMPGFYPTGTYITHMPCPPVGIPRWKPVSMYPDKINITVCGGGCACDTTGAGKTVTLTTPSYEATLPVSPQIIAGTSGVIGNIVCATFSGVPNLGPFGYSWDFGPAYPKPGDSYPYPDIASTGVFTFTCPTGNVVLVTNQCPTNQGASSTPLIWACKDFSIPVGCGNCTTHHDTYYYCCPGGPTIHGPDVSYTLTCPIGATTLEFRTDLYGNPNDNCSPSRGREGWWGKIVRPIRTDGIGCTDVCDQFHPYPSGSTYTVYFRFFCGHLEVGWWTCSKFFTHSCSAGCGKDAPGDGFVYDPPAPKTSDEQAWFLCGFTLIPDTSHANCDAPMWLYTSERFCGSQIGYPPGECRFFSSMASLNPDDHYTMHYTLSTSSGNFTMVVS